MIWLAYLVVITEVFAPMGKERPPRFPLLRGAPPDIIHPALLTSVGTIYVLKSSGIIILCFVVFSKRNNFR